MLLISFRAAAALAMQRRRHTLSLWQALVTRRTCVDSGRIDMFLSGCRIEARATVDRRKLLVASMKAQYLEIGRCERFEKDEKLISLKKAQRLNDKGFHFQDLAPGEAKGVLEDRLNLSKQYRYSI